MGKKKTTSAPPAGPRITPLDQLAEAAECLRVLAHPHRLRMLQLVRQGDFTVGELAAACEIVSPAASEHLRLMERCGFLVADQRGRRRYYRLAEEHVPHLTAILTCIESRFGAA
ncbi:ArsR/SmtB family transcription factor [Botrimarina hoheduenensis]|uniref:Biofilm growth-associated repressor n=1 Tax=Botrimarina hoheduenensis TaxID=2528000 RepID=A0A5C5VXU3_9BACT|nr:metalloregulator ArsR/SmtB family transcription factor [Botrimarina hoheduenensis]TWT42733.1 Biofilm growth-associated repressor [Botrimarina hoheduenensis]